MPKDTELAWLAGIIDGEGCIHIRLDRATEKTKQASDMYSLVLKITMTHKLTVNRIKEITGVGALHVARKARGNWKEAYSWVCSTRKADEILALVMPFLVTKKNQAETAREFIALGRGRGGKARVPETLQATRREYYWKMRYLNTGSTPEQNKAHNAEYYEAKWAEEGRSKPT